MAQRSAAIFDASKSYSPLSVPSAQTAVLLMDYQNFIVSMAGDKGPATVQAARKLRDWAHSKGMPVYHCLVDLTPGTSPPPNTKFSERWPTYEAALKKSPELAGEPDELTIDSRHGDSGAEQIFSRRMGYFSALTSVGLPEELRQRGIRSLIVAGLGTSGVVLSTVRSATDAGYLVTVAEDGCTDPTPGLHDALMQHTIPAGGHVASSEEIFKAWEGI